MIMELSSKSQNLPWQICIVKTNMVGTELLGTSLISLRVWKMAKILEKLNLGILEKLISGLKNKIILPFRVQSDC